MRKNKIFRVKLGLVAALLIGKAALAAPNPQQQTQGARKVDLVIALDTSGSMSGLIDSARQKLWDVVNLLAQAKPQPVLRVGLIAYGSPEYGAQTGWVRKVSDLTTDLDTIYSKLFAFRISGGDEYVARAVKTGLEQMAWDQDSKTLKIIFVAGNEPATQDPQFGVESVVQAAREKGVFVNAIYCGSDGAGEAMGWRNVAKLGQGQYAAIDHNKVVNIVTPMDAELGKLSGELNKTYLGYGRMGGEKAELQKAQDSNARDMSGSAAASRAQAKASALYSNDEWDLVDAKKKGKKVAEMAEEELPVEMKNMKPAQREAFVQEKAKDRERIQARINDLSKKREEFIAAERKKRTAPGAYSFDDAVLGSVRTQAEAKGFSIPAK
jgi:hypothetical protein